MGERVLRGESIRGKIRGAPAARISSVVQISRETRSPVFHDPDSSGGVSCLAGFCFRRFRRISFMDFTGLETLAFSSGDLSTTP